MILSFAISLRVIPIGVPTSNRRPTPPIHFALFFTALPSILKPKWYPACVLDLDYSRRKPNTLKGSLYPTFVVYFMDYTQPNDLESYPLKKKGVNLFFNSMTFKIYYYFKELLRFEYRVSFITYKFQT